MDLTTTERDRRHNNLRKVMQDKNLDVIIGRSDGGDQSGLQRYISNLRSPHGEVAAMLYREKDCDLVVSHPGAVGIAKAVSWATDVHYFAVPNTKSGKNDVKASASGQVANLLSGRKVKRIGVFNMEYFPSGWKEEIIAAIPDVEFVDAYDDVHRLRLIKSKVEQDLVRESCRISDEVWKQVPEVIRLGRKRYEVMADLEHIVRLNGCEENFPLLMALPMSPDQLNRHPYSDLPIGKNQVFNVEVSPRYLGYFGQQTSIVATGTFPKEIRDIFDAVNRARDEGLKVIKPGVNLTEVGQVVYSDLAKSGYRSLPSFGHLVGLELEDHHIDESALVLEEGMTFIFHPMVETHRGVMRADTYLITASGCERLTSGDIGPLELKLG